MMDFRRVAWLILFFCMPSTVIADQPPTEQFAQPCFIVGLFGDGEGAHSACLWQTQLRRRADLLECSKETIKVPSLRDALLASIDHDKWVYWIVVGDGDWLVQQVYRDDPGQQYYSCLYRHARKRGDIDWPHDAILKNAQGEFERWTINEDGRPEKVTAR